MATHPDNDAPLSPITPSTAVGHAAGVTNQESNLAVVAGPGVQAAVPVEDHFSMSAVRSARMAMEDRLDRTGFKDKTAYACTAFQHIFKSHDDPEDPGVLVRKVIRLRRFTREGFAPDLFEVIPSAKTVKFNDISAVLSILHESSKERLLFHVPCNGVNEKDLVNGLKALNQNVA